ncbi:MAG: hypothetical protein CMO55_22830 [Verrucomicrobiales bacterium]|nr:hypothetical protein [Verrucomicrobiales bacterium]
MKRTRLFQLQGLLSILLILIAAAQMALSSEGAPVLKVAIAPFGAVSLLLFAFFVYNRRVAKLDDEEDYSVKRILANLGLVAVSGAVIVGVITLLGDLTSSLDRIVFIFAIITAVVFFIYEKLRDFKSMAMLTGIGEGVVILLIFFR